MGCHVLLQGIFPAQGLNCHLLCLLHLQEGSLSLVPPGKPNMLSRFLISWLQSPSAVILEPNKIKSVTAPTFSSSICSEPMGLDAIIFNMEFQASLFILFFHLHQEAVRFLSLSAIRVVSSACLRLLIFLPANLIPHCDSSSLAFLHDALCIEVE